MRNKIKVAVVSDIHNDFRIIKELKENSDIGKYEILFICGDLTQMGTEYELDVMFDRLSEIKRVSIIVVAGNHDIALTDKGYRKKVHSKYMNLTILHNSYYLYNGFSIYGTPYSKNVGDWAFGCSDDDFEKNLPNKHCDILLTHCPPSHGYLSYYGKNNIGFKSLTKFLKKTDNIKYNFHGHCHECGGNFVIINQTLCHNVSDGISYKTLILG